MRKRIPVSKRSASLRYYYRRRRKFEPSNPDFTVLGNRRRGNFKKYFTRSAKRQAANEQQRCWHNQRTAENRARGLTGRGTIPVNRVFPMLRGLKRPEYDRRKYQVLKAERIRTGLGTLLAGDGGLITRLK